MTDKELKKLSRTELLELLLVQSKEIDRLNRELEKAEAALQQRDITLSQSGNIAEAALQLNGVFDAAQAAADQYLENLRTLETQMLEQARQKEQETQTKCDQLLAQTHQDVKKVWEVIRNEIYNPKLDYTQWQSIADYIDAQLKTNK